MCVSQGVLKALNVNKLTKAGCTFKFWVADWFALLNNKMGGDLKKIQKVGQYMIEVWAAYIAVHCCYHEAPEPAVVWPVQLGVNVCVTAIS